MNADPNQNPDTPAPPADCVSIPRDLWVQIFWVLQTYAYAGNWKPYQHAKFGLQEPVIGYIGYGAAKRMLDLVPPALWRETLTPDAVSGD